MEEYLAINVWKTGALRKNRPRVTVSWWLLLERGTCILFQVNVSADSTSNSQNGSIQGKTSGIFSCGHLCWLCLENSCHCSKPLFLLLLRKNEPRRRTEVYEEMKNERAPSWLTPQSMGEEQEAREGFSGDLEAVCIPKRDADPVSTWD